MKIYYFSRLCNVVKHQLFIEVMHFKFCSYFKILYFMSTFAIGFFFFLKGALQNTSCSLTRLDFLLLGVRKDFTGEIISKLKP